METAATTTTSPPRFPDSSPVGKGHLPTLHPLGNFGASILALSALDPRCFFLTNVYWNILLPMTQ